MAHCYDTKASTTMGTRLSKYVNISFLLQIFSVITMYHVVPGPAISTDVYSYNLFHKPTMKKAIVAIDLTERQLIISHDDAHIYQITPTIEFFTLHIHVF